VSSRYTRAQSSFVRQDLQTPNLQEKNKVMEERRMLNANHAALRDSFATQSFNFIFVEIELRVAFCQTARTISKEEVVTRSYAHKKKLPEVFE
jgi:hypothetical protein